MPVARVRRVATERRACMFRRGFCCSCSSRQDQSTKFGRERGGELSKEASRTNLFILDFPRSVDRHSYAENFIQFVSIIYPGLGRSCTFPLQYPDAGWRGEELHPAAQRGRALLKVTLFRYFIARFLAVGTWYCNYRCSFFFVCIFRGFSCCFVFVW